MNTYELPESFRCHIDILYPYNTSETRVKDGIRATAIGDVGGLGEDSNAGEAARLWLREPYFLMYLNSRTSSRN